MTTLNLNKLWLDRLDLGDAIAMASGRDRSSVYAIDGSVRKYASGRMRAISTAGVKTEVSRRGIALDFATKEKLISWLGEHVQMRDHRGNRWFGVFYAVEIGEYMRPDLYAATITLQVVTTVEGV